MKVLLPIDGSECSFSTLQWAADTFDKSLTQYYLLFVVNPVPAMVGLDAAKALEYDLDYANEALERFKTELQNSGCMVERFETATGEPSEEIRAYASVIQADQIILGSHGRTGMSKLILGSVSLKVLEHCQCPVTIHREFCNG